MFLRQTFLTLCLGGLAALPVAAHAGHRYSVHIVAAAGSSASGINSSGAVVGDFPTGGNRHGFVNADGVSTDLGTLGGPNSYAAAINDGGIIVGRADDGAGNQRAFKVVAGVMLDLGTLGGANSRADAINNRGDIVGSADVPPGPGSYSSAFLLRAPALMQDIGRFEVPDPEGGSAAYAINESRKIAGGSVLGPYTPPESAFHAFLFACEEMKDLGTLGGQFSIAYGINEHGKVVGEASTPELRDNRAFIYHRGEMHSLGTLPGGGFSSARAINDKNQVVGYAQASLGGGGWQKAFLYRYGTMLDLNTLINPALGWTLQEAVGINNSGQIAANGCKAGVCYALRLDPVP